MSSARAEEIVLQRFADKCRIAGGPKTGYMLRKESIQYGLDDELAAATEEALRDLVERGLLAPNESADRYFLTESGVEALGSTA